MPAVDLETLDRWRELVVVDRDGAAVGTISEFYLDRESGQPTWALIDRGALRAIDSSACPRSWRICGPRRLRRHLKPALAATQVEVV